MYFLSVSHVAWFNAAMWALARLHRSESTIAYTLNSAEAAGMLYVLTAEWSPLRQRTQGCRRRLTQNSGRDGPLPLSASIHHFLRRSVFQNVLVS